MIYPYFSFNTEEYERTMFPNEKLWKEACLPYKRNSVYGFCSAVTYYNLHNNLKEIQNRIDNSSTYRVLEKLIDSILEERTKNGE